MQQVAVSNKRIPTLPTTNCVGYNNPTLSAIESGNGAGHSIRQVGALKMELFLNLLWLLIAAVLLCTWRTQWIHERRGGMRHRVREWSAVSVALVLLFFAVSMSDDMHAQIVALEERSSNKRDQIYMAGPHCLPESGTATHMLALAAPSAMPRIGLEAGPADPLPANRLFASHLPGDLHPSRAPPVSLL
jgi:hypothetical protein